MRSKIQDLTPPPSLSRDCITARTGQCGHNSECAPDLAIQDTDLGVLDLSPLPPSPTSPGDAESAAADQEPAAKEQDQEPWQEQHAAAMVGQRARLQELEQSVAQIKQTLAQRGDQSEPSDDSAELARQEQERTTRLLEEQERSLQRKQQ